MIPAQSSGRIPVLRTGLACLLLAQAMTSLVPAQEALRLSLAGQDAAEARKKKLSTENFNVKLGPVAMRFDGSLGIEATDNVRNSDSNTESDLVIRPQVNVFSAWRVTEKNSLTFGMGLGYTKYLNASDYDRLLISPDTDLSFDLYVGDFAINFHDRFDYSQDVSTDPTVSGTGSLSRFENTLGVNVVWDLNDVIVTSGYDHRNYLPTQSQFDYLEHSAELLTGTVMFRVRPTVFAGLEVGGGLMDYDQDILQDNTHIAIGPAISVELSEYTSFRMSGGYVIYSLDTYGKTNLTSTTDAFYLDMSMSQRLGRLVDHTLSVGRSVQSGIASDLVDMWHVRHGADWKVLRKTGVSTSISYERGTTSQTLGEELERYGFGIIFSRQLTQKMSGSLGYQFYLKNSDLAGRDYTQNRLVLNLGYAF